MKVQKMYEKYGEIYVKGSNYNFGWHYCWLLFDNLDYYNQWLNEGCDEFSYRPISKTEFNTRPKDCVVYKAYKHPCGVIDFHGGKF